MMQTVLLDTARHDRNRFNCGSEILNNYLKMMANQQAKKDNSWNISISNSFKGTLET